MKNKNKNNNYGDYNLSIIEHIDENMNVEYIKSSAIKNCINALENTITEFEKNLDGISSKLKELASKIEDEKENLSKKDKERICMYRDYIDTGWYPDIVMWHSSIGLNNSHDYFEKVCSSIDNNHLKSE